MARAEIIKFNEIRIVRMNPKLFTTIKKLAKENKRSMGAQAEILLQEILEKKNN